MPTALSETPERVLRTASVLTNSSPRLPVRSSDQGLTSEDARARLERFGRNELAAEPPIACLAAVSFAISGCARHPAAHRHGSLGRSLGVRARSSVALRGHRHLRRGASERDDGLHPGIESGGGGRRPSRDVSGRRDRHSRRRAAQRVRAAEIVPGDIILVEEGDTIPADARLIESAALHTAEAALTGESLPGHQEHGADCRRCTARRSRQHDLQWHRRHLRARQSDRDRHRNAAPRWAASPDS